MKAPRPFVLVNMAMTADGKLATENRLVTSFGSRRDLEHLYELRATADAVMSGARTIEEARSKLSPGGKRFQRLRLKRGLAEFNLRVVVSGRGTIDPRSPVFRHHIAPLIILTTARVPAKKLRQLRELADEVFVSGDRELDFAAALRHLRKKWNVKRLLCEGGGELNDGLLRAGLFDELHLTICPRICGGEKAPTIVDGLGFARLSQARPMKLISSKRIGDELFLVFRAK